MERPPTSPVMSVINDYLGQWPEESRGFIIALPAAHNAPLGRARWYSGEDGPLSSTGIVAAAIDDIHKAKLFESYQEAWKKAQWCAKAWAGGRFADTIRIVEVTRRAPLIVHSSRPIGVLDALAEL
jgi:hypothetical protein